MKTLAIVLLAGFAACGGDSPGAGGSGSAGRSGGAGGMAAAGGSGAAGSSSGGAAGAASRDGGPVDAQMPMGDAEPLFVELGGGPDTFRHLADGDRLPIVPGSQGLPMVILAARTRGFESGNPAMPTLRDPLFVTSCVNVATNQEVGSGRMQQGMHRTPDGYFEFLDGWTPFLASDPAWRGQRLRCTGTLTDANNRRASDVREIIAGN